MTIRKGPILTEAEYRKAIELGQAGGTLAGSVAPYIVRGTRRLATSLIQRFIRAQFKKITRPGVGSKVTKGPLMLGKQKLLGSKRPGTGTIAKAAAGVAGVGIAAVASHRQAPKTAASPRPSASPAPAPSQGQRKCCPLGTKRMVCFKRGRVKPRKKAKPRKKRVRAKRAKRKTARRRRRR